MNPKRILTICILLQMMASISYAQFNHFLPDSVIVYSLHSIDTSNKVASIKIKNSYDEKYRLKDKFFYKWHAEYHEWIPTKHFHCMYFPNEILIECFTIENKKQDVLTGRFILALDTNMNMKEVRIYTKDRYKENFDLIGRNEYAYKKDTLTSVKKYKKQDLEYLAQETNYTYKNGKWQWTQKKYNSIDAKPISTATGIATMQDKKVVKEKIHRTSNAEISSTDTMIYTPKNLMSRMRKVDDNESNIKNFETVSNEIIAMYDTTQHLKYTTQFAKNKEGKNVQSSMNIFTKYFCNPNSRIESAPFNKVFLEALLDE